MNDEKSHFFLLFLSPDLVQVNNTGLSQLLVHAGSVFILFVPKFPAQTDHIHSKRFQFLHEQKLTRNCFPNVKGTFSVSNVA